MLIAAALGVPHWERYGSFAVLGLAGVLPWLRYRRAPQLRLLSRVLVLVFTGTTVGQIVGDWGTVHAEQGSLAPSLRPRLVLSALDPGLPIVAANPMTFNEMADREAQAVSDRLFYLTDRDAATRYSGYTLFENEDKIVAIPGLPAHAQTRERFLATHPRFYLVANFNSEAQWLPSWLADHGADVNYLGKFASTYEDDDLYFVTLAAGSWKV